MSFLTENPVLQREVRSRLRWRRIPKQTLLRAGAVVTVFAIICYTRLITLIAHGSPDDSVTLWWVITYGLLVLTALLAPALAATAISQEREQQTWEGLIITRLTPQQILLGKWTARQMLLGVTLLILAPLLIAVAIKGALPFPVALLTLVTLIVTSGFYSSIGMLCSFVARRTPAATASSLLIVVFLCLGTLIVNVIFSQLVRPFYSYQYDPIHPILWLNPFTVMDAVQNFQRFQRNDNYEPDFAPSYDFLIFIYIALAIVLSLLMFMFMTGRFRRPGREG